MHYIYNFCVCEALCLESWEKKLKTGSAFTRVHHPSDRAGHVIGIILTASLQPTFTRCDKKKWEINVKTSRQIPLPLQEK